MKRFKNILFVMNDKEDYSSALQQAVTLAAHNQAKITVFDVLEDFTGFEYAFGRIRPQEIMENMVKERIKCLHDIIAPIRQEIKIDVVVSRGKAFYEIIRSVLEHKFDLVIKTCHQQGSLKTMLFGTTDMHLLRKCPCPVWLIKPQKVMRCQRILAAIDIEPSFDDEARDALNQQILEMSTSLAISEFAELHIVHAWMLFDESPLLSFHFEQQNEEFTAWLDEQKIEIKARFDMFKDKLDQMLSEQGSNSLYHKVHFVEGDACEIIPQMAKEKEVDLVIMGTIARTGVAGFFMGNTAEGILNQLNCSVLAVKPEGFVSPVTL